MATEMTPELNQKRHAKARRLVTLVYLLQALHPLFGITAVIGMIINHTNNKSVSNTVYESHFRWQITTFWVALAAYALSFYLWLNLGLWLFVPVVSALVGLRIVRGWWKMMVQEPVGIFW